MIFMLRFHCICFKISQETRCWKLSTRRAPCSLRSQASVTLLPRADAEVPFMALQPHKHAVPLPRSSGHRPQPCRLPNPPWYKKQKSQKGLSCTYATCSCYFGAERLKFQQPGSFLRPTAGSYRRSTQAPSAADWVAGEKEPRTHMVWLNINWLKVFWLVLQLNYMHLLHTLVAPTSYCKHKDAWPVDVKLKKITFHMFSTGTE